MLHPPNRNFRCEICNVKANDQGGLDMHLAGKKHKKKVYQKKSKWSAYMQPTLFVTLKKRKKVLPKLPSKALTGPWSPDRAATNQMTKPFNKLP